VRFPEPTPPIYIEKYGHPRLRMRNDAFVIDKSARDNLIARIIQAPKKAGQR
jgi:truncated hemoglobin YjbI